MNDIRYNFLPGPVSINVNAYEAFCNEPVSHRSKEFIRDVNHTKKMLCRYANAENAEIFLGSGTLANDVIGAQLSAIGGAGLVLSNGEFGDRLIDHATRFGLEFGILQADWGEMFKPQEIREAVTQYAKNGWVWAVHCETSTGIVNDLDLLKEVCREEGIILCMDCISSIGTIPVDLNGVHYASTVSGKGLASLPGLAIVFYKEHVSTDKKSIPRYLDLGLYRNSNGIPFTTSSNLMYALRTALDSDTREKRFVMISELAIWFRKRLVDLGFKIITPMEKSSPAIFTIELPREISSQAVGEDLQNKGFLISFNSSYLLERNWIQIILMGECSREKLQVLLDELKT
jgi:aspartate aminotransferase-like enzyme